MRWSDVGYSRRDNIIPLTYAFVRRVAFRVLTYCHEKVRINLLAIAICYDLVLFLSHTTID
jgi:hypothetical protein